MLAELRITPVQARAGFRDQVARVLQALRGSPLHYQVHAMGTTLEGELDSVLDAVRRCHDALCGEGSRILIELAIDDRPAPGGEILRSLEHVQAAAPDVPLALLGVRREGAGR